jgi:Domain of unknown function (DUF4261)
MSSDDGRSSIYPIELMARQPITIDVPSLEASLAKRLGRVKTANVDAGVTLLFLEDFPVVFKDGAVPAQIALLPVAHAASKPERQIGIDQAVGQSWALPGARDLVRDCNYSLLFTNMMSLPLSHEVRRKIIVNGLMAIIETHELDLLFWQPTQQFLSPAEVRERYSDPAELSHPVHGFLNVRFFNIAGSGGDMIMDTLGLGALGLTDLQIHFRKLESNPVAQFMHNLGAYIFENGDVIGDGHTVAGLNGDRWECHFEESLLEPKRTVLDVNPGPEFAAGERR